MAGREDLTGMDLIKRELGGKIIAEIAVRRVAVAAHTIAPGRP
jgi:hypothetical protein